MSRIRFLGILPLRLLNIFGWPTAASCWYVFTPKHWRLRWARASVQGLAPQLQNYRHIKMFAKSFDYRAVRIDAKNSVFLGHSIVSLFLNVFSGFRVKQMNSITVL